MALRLIRRGGRAAEVLPQDPDQRIQSEPAPPAGRSSRARIMIVLALGAAAVALLVIERSAGPPMPQVPAPALEGEPDIFMESPVVSQYRDDGTVEYRLLARTASHYQGQYLTLLDDPRLTLFRGQASPWRVTARKGSLSRPPGTAAEETVTLDDHVVLQTTENGGQIRLTTPSLTLFPQREYAETDRDVMIDSLFGRTTATGLQGDLEKGTLKLSTAAGTRVRTVLQPEQFK